MADITAVKIVRNELCEYPELQNITDSFRVDFTQSDDEKILIIISNSGEEATLTLKAGNGIQGTENAEQTFTISQEEKKTLVIESGKYKNVEGEDKGFVVFTVGSGSVDVGALILP